MNPSAVLRPEEVNSTSYSTFHPILTDGILTTNNVLCGVIGIPLNVLTAALIVFSPRLHQSRNILWLGVAFSNVLILFQHLLEFYANQFQSETTKKIFNLVIGLPYASLALNLFLSLIDRYVSIAHSSWYKRKVNITWIVSGQIGWFSIICVLMKGPYFLEIFQYSPRITTTELKLYSATGFFTLLLCIFAQIFVYTKVKCFLCLEKDMDVSPSTDEGMYNRQGEITHRTTEFMGGELPREREQEVTIDDLRHLATAASLQNSSVILSPHFIRTRDQTISRLELKAARHAVDSASLFFMFSLPTCVALLFAASAGCSSSDYLIRHQECSAYLWFLAYARGLIVLYTIVNPIFFFIRGPDLSRALNRSG